MMFTFGFIVGFIIAFSLCAFALGKTLEEHKKALRLARDQGYFRGLTDRTTRVEQ